MVICSPILLNINLSSTAYVTGTICYLVCGWSLEGGNLMLELLYPENGKNLGLQVLDGLRWY
ncbi:hypothetical protein WN55_10834 [Dufourea novaeangliae]|uniref:Uncharacterized protein n=1 Tax=Dufourea novaeangliae TaxID=178035 RepID=A0A154P9A2_DUFNO|nr:hypothetical protein WN55_10834 [Dufourea novaeangliae]